MSTRHAARFVVTGRVQGVAFRAYTRTEAVRLGVVGHAINRPDGSVEVWAIGAPEAVEALAAWLRRGSPMARVDEVSRVDEALPPALPQGFGTA